MPAGSPAGPNGATLPAIALADALGMCRLQAHGHCGLGMLYAATSEQAWAERSAAIDLYHAMAMTFWLPETESALAQVERAHGL
jgi:hypothetical protein